MGDYTLCNLHFALKEETPEEIKAPLYRRISSEKPLPEDPEFLKNIFHISSAYHHYESFTKVEANYDHLSGEPLGVRINALFQAKYGRGIQEFVAWISPWVVINDRNKRCIRWTLSEYCDVPTYLFAFNPCPDPKDLYIQELENKCHELVMKLQKGV